MENKEIAVNLKLNTNDSVAQIKKVKGATDTAAQSMGALKQQSDLVRESLELGQALVGGIAAINGVLALTGSQNEEVLKTITRLMAGQQLLEGTTRAYNFLLKENTIVTKALTTAQNIYNAVLAKSAVAIAAVTAGVALLVGGAILAIRYLTQQKETVIDLTEANQAARDSLSSTIEVTNRVEAAFKMAKEGVLGKEQALKIYNKELGESMGELNSLEAAEENYFKNKDAFIEATALRARALALFSQAAQLEAVKLTATLEDNNKWYERWTGAILNYFGFAGEASNLLRERNAVNTQQIIDDNTKQIDAINKLATEILTQSEEIGGRFFKISDKTKETAKKFNEEVVKEAQRLEEIRIGTLEEGKEKEIEIAKTKYSDLLAEVAQYLGTESQLYKDVLIQRQTELDAIEAEYNEKKKAKDLETAKLLRDENIQLLRLESESNLGAKLQLLDAEYYEEIEQIKALYGEKSAVVIALENKLQKEKQKVTDQANKDQLLKERVLTDQKLQLANLYAQSYLNILRFVIDGETASANERKALALFEVAINEGLAIAKAVSSAKGLTGIDYAIQVATAVAAATSAIVQARNIIKGASIYGSVSEGQYLGGLTYTGGSTVNVGSISQGGGGGAISQGAAQSTTAAPAQIIKAYVLENDITEKQKEVEYITRLSIIN
jgi:hypothetical protein